MQTLYRQNVPYLVPAHQVSAKLAEGFTRAPVNTQPSAAINAQPSVQIPPDAVPPEGLINVNTCNAAELVALQGIGVKTANEIIDGRPYESLDWFLADPRTVPHLEKFTL